MAFIITKVGTALKCVDSVTGDTTIFTLPTIKLLSTLQYPAVTTPCVEIKQADRSVQLTVALTTSINGVTGATLATLAAIADALVASGPAGNLAVATNASGATYNAFASQAASSATIFNGTGVAIDVLRGGTGVAVSVGNGQQFTFTGITNTSQLSVRRTDTSNTPVTVGISWAA